MGRIVHYIPEWAGVAAQPKPLPAIITHVDDDQGTVTLGVFGRSYYPATAVYLEPAGAEHDSLPVPGTWYWPPRSGGIQALVES